MKLTEIPVGTKLEIEAYNHLNEKYDFKLVSQLVVARDEKSIIIYAPIKEGIVFPLSVESTIIIYSTIKISEGNYHLYRFKAIVRNRGFIDEIAMMEVDLASSIDRVQRRKFFRFEYSVPVDFKVLDVPKIDVTENSDQESYLQVSDAVISSFTKDIGGEGICIYSVDKIQLGSLLRCELQLDSGKIIVKGKIVKVLRLENKGKFNYENGVSFFDITEPEREAIIKFIFRVQRKLREKGLI